MEIAHQISFRLYGLPLVQRSQYVKIDRHRLSYLSWIERINCAYCGYANGLLQYSARIAGDTEKYWCGIKHKKDRRFVEPTHHRDLLEYGDEKSFNEKFV